ncbi:MAG: hypothetical protein CBD21_04370 [bacterium TMED161]|nr:MAG: hypothetical protein CBD21_04370 [bacterium TMED161]
MSIFENWNKIKFTTRIAVLDWLFVFAIIILLLIVYIPNQIWIQEKFDRDESRFRMRTISNASEFYKEITGNYTINGPHMFELVEAAIDSAFADSLFFGEQQIILNDKIFNVSINKGFDYRADTTFSIAEQIRKTIVDTLYWTLEYSDSTKTLLDTNYVNSSDIKKRMNLYRFNPANTSLLSERDSTITEEEYDDLLSFEQKRFYRVVKDTIPGKIEISAREEVKNNYLRKKFHLNTDLLTCPLSKKDYILALEQQNSGENIFIVKSPVDESNIETQYYFFEYNPGDHGYIRSGVQSWAGEE